MNYSRGEPSSDRADRAAEAVAQVVPRAMRQIRSIARAEAGGLSVPQFRALGYVVRHPGVGLTELAEHLGVSLPAASALVGRLVASGLVNRTSDPEERRRIQIVVTAAGNARILAATAAVRAWWRAKLADLGATELERLTAAMQTLETLLEAAEPLESLRPVSSTTDAA